MEQPITQESIIKKLGRLSPEGLAEVSRFIDALQARKGGRRHGQAAQGRKYPAFGIWADREETADPVAFANQLRHMVEGRQDGERYGG
jgi:hypothetical protein